MMAQLPGLVEIVRSYRTLGVELGAPLSQVRKRYLELIKIWHPDVSREARQAAEVEARRFNEAIGVIRSLSPDDIVAVKRYLSAARGARFHPGRPRRYRPRTPARSRHRPRTAARPTETGRIGRDIFGELFLTPRQAARGSRWNLHIATCRQCGGWGAALGADFRVCGFCAGLGLARSSPGGWNFESHCGACGGKGCSYAQACARCGGSGECSRHTVRCRIPRHDGSSFIGIVRRHGHPGVRGGAPGHLYLRLSVK